MYGATPPVTSTVDCASHIPRQLGSCVALRFVVINPNTVMQNENVCVILIDKIKMVRSMLVFLSGEFKY